MSIHEGLATGFEMMFGASEGHLDLETALARATATATSRTPSRSIHWNEGARRFIENDFDLEFED